MKASCATLSNLYSPPARGLSSLSKTIVDNKSIMHTSFLVGSALFTRSLAAILTPSASTSDPTITPGPQIELLRKQNDDRYMGWVSYDGVWSTQECESGATYFQSSGHWRCCATTIAGCDIPQACVNGNLIYSISSTSLTIPWYVHYGATRSKYFTDSIAVHLPIPI